MGNILFFLVFLAKKPDPWPGPELIRLFWCCFQLDLCLYLLQFLLFVFFTDLSTWSNCFWSLSALSFSSLAFLCAASAFVSQPLLFYLQLCFFVCSLCFCLSASAFFLSASTFTCITLTLSSFVIKPLFWSLATFVYFDILQLPLL